MTTGQIVVGAVLLIAAAALLLLAVRQFGCKGYCLNNAYIWANKKTREETDFTPYYKQSGVILSMISAMDLFNGLYVLLESPAMLIISAAVMTAALIYSVVSSAKIEKENKNK